MPEVVLSNRKQCLMLLRLLTICGPEVRSEHAVDRSKRPSILFIYTDVIPSGREAFHGGAPWYVMLREGRYKYVRPLIPDDLEELYDLQQDPEELANLAVQPEHAPRLERLRAAAIAELQRAGAGFIGSMPPVH